MRNLALPRHYRTPHRVHHVIAQPHSIAWGRERPASANVFLAAVTYRHRTPLGRVVRLQELVRFRCGASTAQTPLVDNSRFARSHDGVVIQCEPRSERDFVSEKEPVEMVVLQQSYQARQHNTHVTHSHNTTHSYILLVIASHEGMFSAA